MEEIQLRQEDGDQEASDKTTQCRQEVGAKEAQAGTQEAKGKETRDKDKEIRETGDRPKDKAVGVRQEAIDSETRWTRDRDRTTECSYTPSFEAKEAETREKTDAEHQMKEEEEEAGREDTTMEDSMTKAELDSDREEEKGEAEEEERGG